MTDLISFENGAWCACDVVTTNWSQAIESRPLSGISGPNASALAAKLSCTLPCLKWERVVVQLTVKIDSSRTRSCPFTGYRKLEKRDANGLLQFAEETGTQKLRHGFALAILCQVCCSFLHTYSHLCYLFCVTVKSC